VTLREALLHGRGRRRRAAFRGEGRVASRRGDGLAFAELRAYTATDDPRRIDWAASARSGALQTRSYLEEDALAFVTITDGSATMALGRKRPLAEAAREAVAAWEGALGNDDRAARIANGGYAVAPGRGVRAALALAALAPTATDMRRDCRTAATVPPRGAALLIVSDFLWLTAADAELLAMLGARCDATALVARDPWRDDFPLRGYVRLRDAQSGRVGRVFVDTRNAARLVAASRARDAAIDAALLQARFRVGTLAEADGKRALHAAFDLV
jgi:uncharacterized protein (DUF58 family)